VKEKMRAGKRLLSEKEKVRKNERENRNEGRKNQRKGKALTAWQRDGRS